MSEADSVRRKLPGAVVGGRLSGLGHDAHRSATAWSREIQPRAHLDARRTRWASGALILASPHGGLGGSNSSASPAIVGIPNHVTRLPQDAVAAGVFFESEFAPPRRVGESCCAFATISAWPRCNSISARKGFVCQDFRRFLAQNASDIASHKSRQQAAFEANGGAGRRAFNRVAADLPAPHVSARPRRFIRAPWPVAVPVSGSALDDFRRLGPTRQSRDMLVTVER